MTGFNESNKQDLRKVNLAYLVCYWPHTYRVCCLAHSRHSISSTKSILLISSAILLDFCLK